MRTVLLYALRYEKHSSNDISGLLSMLARRGVKDHYRRVSLTELNLFTSEFDLTFLFHYVCFDTTAKRALVLKPVDARVSIFPQPALPAADKAYAKAIFRHVVNPSLTIVMGSHLNGKQSLAPFTLYRFYKVKVKSCGSSDRSFTWFL